jgi:hypothetical protein
MLLAVALVMALAVSAAGQQGANPECQVCIDFSGTASSWTEVQSRIDPEPYTVFSAYFTIYGINEFTTITLMGYVTPGMSTPPTFTNLLPGDIAIGTWDTGITMASTDCIADDFLYVARMDFFYLGVPGDVMFLDHPTWPRWVVDCSAPCNPDELCLNYYCPWMHGGVHKDPIEGDMDCFPLVPVENASWGAVKAMFR